MFWLILEWRFSLSIDLYYKEMTDELGFLIYRLSGADFLTNDKDA